MTGTADPRSIGAGRLYSAAQAMELAMLVLVVGREAGNQPREAMLAVACSIRNRVDARKARWGDAWEDVIEHAWQYSSIAGPAADPNLRKYINLSIAPWPTALEVSELVYSRNVSDTTAGAHSYFDRSLDANPPTWSTDGEFVHTVDIGAFHFFKLRGT